jgi:SAM-dependent methyltransferase
VHGTELGEETMNDLTRRQSIALESEGRSLADTALVRHRPSTLEVVPVFLRQAWAEARIRHWRHVRFRSRENEAARDAYARMEAWEFESVNARQAWANWRTIPKNLEGRLPPRPVRALDLCCGTGQSTAVLAYHLPAGSDILGLEYSLRFVSLARSRVYLTRDGVRAPVRFRVQSVLETFHDTDGAPVADGSVDLVNSSGAVGFHFDPRSTAALADEVARVVRPGGLALIDSGHSGTPPAEVRAIFARRGFAEVHAARSCFLDRDLQVGFRRRANGR